MALLHSFENSGNWLFKRRGWLPVWLFLMAIPAVYFSDFRSISVQMKFVITVIAIGISILGQVIRAYTIGTTPKGTSGRNTEEQVAEVLNSTGIYSVVRHPLYLGNYFMWIGIVIYTMNFYFVIIVSLLYWLYYERIMFAEERFLEKKFGKAYLDWSLKAPAFIPQFSKWVASSIPFSFKSVLRREYSGVLATVIGFVFVDALRLLFLPNLTDNHFETDWISQFRFQLYVLAAAVLMTLVLRTLKHSTSVLKEEGRS